MGVKVSSKELRSQLEALVKNRDPELVALATGADFDAETLECQGRVYQVRRARTVLEFYDLVDQTVERPLLCLTQLSDRDIGLDLRSRLYKRRILSTDPWKTVKHLFDCHDLESSLVDQPHLARYLLVNQPREGYSKVKGDVLTADKVWSCLFAFRLGMPADYLDNLSLLQWAAGDCQAYFSAEDDLKQSTRERVYQVCGEYGQTILETLEEGSLDPMALGLALRCLVEPLAGMERVQREALVRLERFTGGRVLNEKVLREWADAAEHLYSADLGSNRALAVRADEILTELQAGPTAVLSDYLPGGLEIRSSDFAATLTRWLQSEAQSQEVELWCRRCLSHKDLGERARQRLSMVPRLVRWLESPKLSKKQSLDALAQRYAWNTAFAEWARLRCEGQSSHKALALPLNNLIDRVIARQEAEAEAFACTLLAWNQAGEPESAGLWGVEQLIEKVLLPIVKTKGGRFLLVVLDGCAWPTLHELMESVSEISWRRLEPESGLGLPSLLATFPSVTEFSRTSLFSGRLLAGNSSIESKNFAEHPQLREACNQGRPPSLFHKADLNSGYEALSSEVETKIMDSKCKAVGVVINTIDDHLDRSDQLDIPWQATSISYLSDLIALANRSGRILVITSDHGHVMERGSELIHSQEDGGARWRPGNDAGTGEISLSGPRVLTGTGSVVLPWSEKVRYTKKKNGYHGGCHPRELLAPLLVLAPLNRNLPGWREASHHKPSWWQPQRAKSRAPVVFEMPKLAVEEVEPESGQMLLVDTTKEKSFADHVLDFPMIAQRWNEQTTVDRGWTRRLLSELEKNGDQAPLSGLAFEFGMSEERFRQLFVQAANLLSLDGRYVVSLSPDTQTVLLNRSALGDVLANKQSGTIIEVERSTGDTVKFTIPVPNLDTREKLVLEALAIHGQVSEDDVKRILKTRRGGIVERLMEKLAKHQFHCLKQIGEGEKGGRLYRLDLGALHS